MRAVLDAMPSRAALCSPWFPLPPCSQHPTHTALQTHTGRMQTWLVRSWLPSTRPSSSLLDQHLLSSLLTWRCRPSRPSRCVVVKSVLFVCFCGAVLVVSLVCAELVVARCAHECSADAPDARLSHHHKACVFCAAPHACQLISVLLLLAACCVWCLLAAAPQVAVQTRPGFAKGLTDGMPKLVQAEGVGT